MGEHVPLPDKNTSVLEPLPSEEDGCGSLDFMFRGLKFHVWEYHDGVWGAETNIYEAGRSEDIEGDYEEKIAGEILSWPDMINN